MVDKFEKDKCNGCAVCGDLCPQKAISFEADKLTGFRCPKVDYNKCIHCGLCTKKCPQNTPFRRKNMPEAEVYAAWSLDDKIRMLCTSGGLFYELAFSVIEYGGAVVACSYTDDFKGSYHCVAVTKEQLISQCGSKHVQSDTVGIYQETRQLLEKYPKVMFVGTPCQVAALYQFLGKEPENLLTVDFICNSINSPKAQSHYIAYLEEIYGAKVVTSRAKDKRYGWNHFGSSARFENGKEYYADRSKDARVVGYHNGALFIRSSCLNCQYKILPRNADITLGDFWGIETDDRNPKLEMGTSAVLTNSVKGDSAFKSISSRIGYYQKTIEDVLKGNRALLYSAAANGNGEKAFAELETQRFDKVVNKYKTKRSFARRILSKIKGRIQRITHHTP